MFISFFSSFPKRWFYRLAAQEAQIFMLQMANEPLQRLIEASINIRPQFFLAAEVYIDVSMIKPFAKIVNG